MVSKAKAVKGSAQAINYILDDKGQAQELGRNLVSGENGEEILAEMREIQEMNARCENNTYSIVLSPSNEREFINRELYEIGVKHFQLVRSPCSTPFNGSFYPVQTLLCKKLTVFCVTFYPLGACPHCL